MDSLDLDYIEARGETLEQAMKRARKSLELEGVVSVINVETIKNEPGIAEIRVWHLCGE